ncbi:MAG: MMPL family transporter [Deltaproteobacteria bacterium]|nr:MMPL family transporter [Deltaproteobacteria bacterium]
MHFVLKKIWRREYFDRLAVFLVRHAKPLLIVGVSAAFLSLFFALKLHVDSDSMVFLPEQSPGVQNLKKVIERTDLRAILEKLNPLQFDEGLKADIGGEFRDKIDENFSVRKNVGRSGLLAFLGICGILYLFYRRASAVFLALVPLMIGTALSFGSAWFVVGRLNPMTVFLLAILFGLGVTYGIYFFSRYLEERPRRESLEETISVILHDTGRATLSSALTAALAFALLIFMDFEGFREFGIIASTGLLIIFASYFVYAPVLWALGEKRGFVRAWFLHPPPRWISRAPTSKGVVYAGLIIAVVCLVLLPFFSFEYDYGKLRDPKIDAVFPDSSAPAVILTDTLEETKGVVAAVSVRMAQADTIEAVKSTLDLFPVDVQGKKAMVFIYGKAPLSDARLAARYADDIRDIRAGGKIYHPAGRSIVFSDALERMRRDSFSAFWVLLLGIYLVLMADFKSAKKAAVAILPPCLGLLMTFGTMVVLGIRLNIFNLAIFPILMGIGINSSIHLYHRYLQGQNPEAGSTIRQAHGGEPSRTTSSPQAEEDSLHQMVVFTGSPLILATLASIIGFAGMLLSDHQGLKNAGLVALIGMAANLLACLGFFPAFLKWQGSLIEKRIKKPLIHDPGELIGVFREKTAESD